MDGVKKRTQDMKGNESSKRSVAFRVVNIALGMIVIDYVIGVTSAVIGREYLYELPLPIVWSLLGTGLVALGFTIPEWFNQRK